MSGNKDISKWQLLPYGGAQFNEARGHLEQWADLQPSSRKIPATPESLASAKAYLDEHMDTEGIELKFDDRVLVVCIVLPARIEAIGVEGTFIT